ncbi:MAG: hypothetical protein H6983_13305 [Ectothiorhodospiraceae bacterium]|nr:hypothetical protein [Ectothiorhodospiraceae bacterium]
MEGVSTLASPLVFRYEGAAHPIRLTAEFAPRTLAMLLAGLPETVDIHCAKIAGNHIFWHGRFVAPFERVADVMSVAPGAFIYYPERQFLELVYGELQAETANVNVLGWVEGDVAWLRALGQRVQRRQGVELITARLEHDGEGAPPMPAPRPTPVHPGLARLRRARESMWAAMPAEFEALLDRRGVMLPVGPLIMAEGELRKLHELLWRLLEAWRAGRRQGVGAQTMFLVEAFVSRIAGFCHLTETGATLERAAAALPGADEVTVDAVLEELVLFTGRAAGWLDQGIPWFDLNEATLAARRARHGVPGR